MEKSVNVPIPEGWSITECLGKGSCGRVFRMERQDGAAAVLKIVSIPTDEEEIAALRANGYSNEAISSILERRLFEIRDKYDIIKDMSGQPNIVRTDDVTYLCRPDGSGCEFLVQMEELIPLKKTLTAAYSEDTVLEIGVDLLSALVRYEQYQLVHGDIKPENVLVSENGEYKLADFGVTDLMVRHWENGSCDGCEFLAPEVYFGKSYDSRADVYSAGMLLYWLCNNYRVPFLSRADAKDKSKVEEAVARRVAGGVIEEPDNGSDPLKQIIAKACSYDPESRYHSAVSMLREVKKLAGKRPAEQFAQSASVNRKPNAPTAPDQSAFVGARPCSAVREPMDLSAYEEPETRPVHAEGEPRRTKPIEDDGFPVVTTSGKKKSNVGIIAAISGLLLTVAACIIVIALLLLKGSDKTNIKPGKAAEETAVPTVASKQDTAQEAAVSLPESTQDTSERISEPPPLVTPETTSLAIAELTPAPTKEDPNAIASPESWIKQPYPVAYIVNFQSCNVNTGYKKDSSRLKNGKEDVKLSTNTKVYLLGIGGDSVLVSLDGTTPYGWIGNTFVFNGSMTKSNTKYNNPSLSNSKLYLPVNISDNVGYDKANFTPKQTIQKSNFRYTPDSSNDSNIIEKKLSKGAKFTILYPTWDPDSNTEWYFCAKTKNGVATYGWVHKENFVVIPTEKPTPSPTPDDSDDSGYDDYTGDTESNASVSGKIHLSKSDSHAALRTAASTDAKCIKEYTNGTSLTVYYYVKDADGKKWYYAKMSDGKIGYLRAEFVSVTGKVPAKP